MSSDTPKTEYSPPQGAGGKAKVLLGSAVGASGALITLSQISKNMMKRAALAGLAIEGVVQNVNAIQSNLNYMLEHSTFTYQSVTPELNGLLSASELLSINRQTAPLATKISNEINGLILNKAVGVGEDFVKGQVAELQAATDVIRTETDKHFQQMTGESLAGKDAAGIMQSVNNAMQLSGTQKALIVGGAALAFGGIAYGLHKRNQRKQSYAEQVRMEQEAGQERLR